MPPTTKKMIEQQLPGRHLGVIINVKTRDNGFVFLRLSDGTERECFVHKSAVPPRMWTTLEDGDALTCRIVETAKGFRAYEIQQATEAEAARAAAEEESRGNR